MDLPPRNAEEPLLLVLWHFSPSHKEKFTKIIQVSVSVSVRWSSLSGPKETQASWLTVVPISLPKCKLPSGIPQQVAVTVPCWHPGSSQGCSPSSSQSISSSWVSLPQFLIPKELQFGQCVSWSAPSDSFVPSLFSSSLAASLPTYGLVQSTGCP